MIFLTHFLFTFGDLVINFFGGTMKHGHAADTNNHIDDYEFNGKSGKDVWIPKIKIWCNYKIQYDNNHV